MQAFSKFYILEILYKNSIYISLQLIVPSGKSNSLGTEYPLFIFDKGFSRDSSFSPQRLPPKDFEFSISSTDIDIEEHFNLI